VTLPQADMSQLQLGAGPAHIMEQPTIDVNHPHMYSHAEQRYQVSRTSMARPLPPSSWPTGIRTKQACAVWTSGQPLLRCMDEWTATNAMRCRLAVLQAGAQDNDCACRQR